MGVSDGLGHPYVKGSVFIPRWAGIGRGDRDCVLSWSYPPNLQTGGSDGRTPIELKVVEARRGKARGPGMPKDRDRKIEEAIVRAESAQQAALNALTIAQVLGSILESTLAMLQAKEVVAPDDLRQIFFGAAAAIDELKPSNENERGAQQAMRATVVHIAKRFRIEIPPPGQTGMPRKH